MTVAAAATGTETGAGTETGTGTETGAATVTGADAVADSETRTAGARWSLANCFSQTYRTWINVSGSRIRGRGPECHTNKSRNDPSFRTSKSKQPDANVSAWNDRHDGIGKVALQKQICLGTLVLALFACGRSVGKPPAAPPANVIRPVVYVPADLDLVLRLDVSRFRQTMGAEPEQSLEKMWEAFGESSSAQSQNSKWMVPALKSTDTLWLGCRLGVKGCKDFVFVLRGRFASARETYGFGPEKNKRDLGAGWFSYDFASSGRAAAARLYWRPPELAVVVSSAEIDSAERSVEHSQNATRLDPSETGLLSLSARSKALAVILRERSPKAADWLSKSERIELRFEPSAKATVATFSVSFLDSSQAETAAQAFRILIVALSGFDNRIKTGDIDVQHLNSDVVLRISFPTAEQTFHGSNSEDSVP